MKINCRKFSIHALLSTIKRLLIPRWHRLVPIGIGIALATVLLLIYFLVICGAKPELASAIVSEDGRQVACLAAQEDGWASPLHLWVFSSQGECLYEASLGTISSGSGYLVSCSEESATIYFPRLKSNVTIGKDGQVQNTRPVERGPDDPFSGWEKSGSQYRCTRGGICYVYEQGNWFRVRFGLTDRSLTIEDNNKIMCLWSAS
jgi:hypothetical protein